MDMLFSGLAKLSDDPRAWILAALVALKAVHSIYLCMRCRVMRGLAEIGPDMIERAKGYEVRPPLSYLLIMVSGMALAVGGLYMINSAEYGPVALGVLVIGVFMFMTEPSRLFVNAAKMEVYATTGAIDDANLLARNRLRDAHFERAMIEIAIAAAVLAALYFF